MSNPIATITQKLVKESQEFTSEADFDKGRVRIFLQDGTRLDFSFSEWLMLFEVALRIVSINADLCDNPV